MSATLTISDVMLPSAALGPADPLPAVSAMPQAPYSAPTDHLPAEIARNIGYGQVSSIHPYLLQDDYDRARTMAPMRVAVLENDHLRAEFALGRGGRLIALVDRATGRDLVYRNAVFQPANLALRNAWFSGGAEWNIGMRGHWPLTCDPLYAAELTGQDGEPVLRMWEYERVRGLILQIDATLDTGAPALHVRVRVRNPHPRETGMYWWTNIAVAQTPGSRVFAPATRAFRTGYDGRLDAVDLAETDPSRPASAPAAADYFFDLGASRALGVPWDTAIRPWIAALDADGSGLAHVSTAPLAGRKLFVWGDTTGGRHWCEWLGGATGAYFEIQAGLTTTQYEHVPMPGGATWEWNETFLPLHVADPVREASWPEAVAAVGAHVADAADRLGPDAHARLDAVTDTAPDALLSQGSPWGERERRLSLRAGSPFATLPGVRFLDDRGGSGGFWTALLDGRDPGDADPSPAPDAYVAGPAWDALLAAAPASWLTHYHRAVIAHARSDLTSAVSHYEASLRERRSPWALRGLGLALIGRDPVDPDPGLALLTQARALAPDCLPLARELGESLLAAGRADEAAALVAGLPASARDAGRFRLLAIRAALAAGEREEAARLLEDPAEVPDLREGELSMSALWREVFPDRPVPERYDFSMAPEV